MRNAAKANRKAHTPVSNEINASSFSGTWGESDREAQSTDDIDCEKCFYFTMNNWSEFGLCGMSLDLLGCNSHVALRTIM